MTEYTCDSFRFFNLFPVYFGGKGTLVLNYAHSCHWFVRLGLVDLQALHQPAVLLRCQLSHLFSVPRPLKTSVLQPFVQQYEAVAFPVQRFHPVTPPPAEQEQRIGKRV